ncbi:amidohydrolase family protein [Primorskyibacter sp. S87]|uniref:metal-dependent hydrolase family protein n=1 Tax=Primorskyibacter sp. S87 TaxID=3415126 RepID=UPI003C7ACE94
MIRQFTRTLATFTFSAMVLVAGTALAQQEPPSVTLFKNVMVFDGNTDGLLDLDVLVVGNKIHKVAEDIPETGTWEVQAGPSGPLYSEIHSGSSGYNFIIEGEEGTQTVKVSPNVIDGRGRTLMPGMIDSHTHFNLSMDGGRPGMEMARWDYMAGHASSAALEWFYDGFTTVRDMGGMADGLRRVIDNGLMEGPRIYSAAGMISQSAGHGDLLFESQTSPQQSSTWRNGIYHIANSPDEVRAAVRRNFNAGATHMKIMMAGGVASNKGPFEASQYTDAEIIAAVEEAATRGTYVAAHLYLDEAIRRALDLGVMSIEHGQFLQEDTAMLMKEKGAFISPYIAAVMSEDILTHPVYGNPSTFEYARTLMMKEGTKNFAEVIKKVKPNIVFSIDIVSTNGMAARHHRDHEKWIFADTFGNYETLKAMTSTGGKLAALTGGSNPYPAPLGVIEEGAYADILLVDGNPLEDITVLGGNSKWFNAEPRKRGIETINLIMKDGVIYKNTLN